MGSIQLNSEEMDSNMQSISFDKLDKDDIVSDDDPDNVSKYETLPQKESSDEDTEEKTLDPEKKENIKDESDFCLKFLQYIMNLQQIVIGKEDQSTDETCKEFPTISTSPSLEDLEEEMHHLKENILKRIKDYEHGIYKRDQKIEKLREDKSSLKDILQEQERKFEKIEKSRIEELEMINKFKTLSSESNAKKYQNQISSLKEELKILEKENEDLQEERRKLKKEVRKIKSRFEEAEENMKESKEKIEKLENENKNLKKQNRDLKRHESQYSEEISVNQERLKNCKYQISEKDKIVLKKLEEMEHEIRNIVEQRKKTDEELNDIRLAATKIRSKITVGRDNHNEFED